VLDDRFHEAQAAHRNGRSDEALGLYDALLKQAIHAERVDLVVDCLMQRGSLLIDLQRYKEAVTTCELILEWIKDETPKQKYLRSHARANILIARGELSGKDARLARDYGDLLADLERAARDKDIDEPLRVALYNQIGNVSYLRGAVLDAIGNTGEVLAAVEYALKRIPESSPVWRAKCYRLRGHILVKGPRRAEGLRDLRTAYRLLADHGVVTQLAQVLAELIRSEEDPGRRAESFRELESLTLRTPGANDALRAVLAAELAIALSNAPAAERWVSHFEAHDYSKGYPHLVRRILMAKAEIGLRTGDLKGAREALASVKALAAASSDDFRTRWDTLELELKVAKRENVIEVWEKSQEMFLLLENLSAGGRLPVPPEYRIQAEYNLGATFLDDGTSRSPLDRPESHSDRRHRPACGVGIAPSRPGRHVQAYHLIDSDPPRLQDVSAAARRQAIEPVSRVRGSVNELAFQTFLTLALSG
jgi:tetratricopeptide (TPR) repeat protein